MNELEIYGNHCPFCTKDLDLAPLLEHMNPGDVTQFHCSGCGNEIEVEKTAGPESVHDAPEGVM